MPDKIPGSAKYRATVMPLRDTEGFPDTPNPEWHKTEIFAYEEDITRIFKKFEREIGFRIGKISFIPKGVDGVKVYFDYTEENSLFIVAESEEIANDYALRLRLTRPYNVSRYRFGGSSFPAWRI